MTDVPPPILDYRRVPPRPSFRKRAQGVWRELSEARSGGRAPLIVDLLCALVALSAIAAHGAWAVGRYGPALVLALPLIAAVLFACLMVFAMASESATVRRWRLKREVKCLQRRIAKPWCSTLRRRRRGETASRYPRIIRVCSNR